MRRFVSADNYTSTGQGFAGLNMYAYCGNNPVMRNDNFGDSWKEILSDPDEAMKKLEEYLASNTYGSTIDGISVTTTSLFAYLKKAMQTAQRPANIGLGTYAKQITQEVQQISRFCSGLSKILSVASYGSLVIDVVTGLKNNLNNETSVKKIISDAAVDTVVTGGSILTAGATGSAIGAFAGSAFPVAGNIIGACSGAAIGAGIYFLTDVVPICGKSARSWAKERVNGLW